MIILPVLSKECTTLADLFSLGGSGGQWSVGIGASSSASSPARVDDADLAADTARCIISLTPNLLELLVPWLDDVVGAVLTGLSELK